MDVTEPQPNIHAFSDGYYLVDGLFVEPNEEITVPRIQDRLYTNLQESYYDEIPTPILFRHNKTKYHFRIEPDENVRSDTIEMPFEFVSELGMVSVPNEEQFLMAKPSHAKMIVDFSTLR